MPDIRRRSAGSEPAAGPRVLLRPSPEEPAKYSRARAIGDFIVMDWYTAHGTVGWAHSLKATSPSARQLADAVYGQFWDHMHEVYAALVVSQVAVNLDLAPRLQAIDLYRGSRLSEAYEVKWAQVASALGVCPPWFHYTLRNPRAILDWKPEGPPAIVPADDIELGTAALLALAADEPEGSPAAAVCLWLARHLRRLAAAEAEREITEIQAEAAKSGSDCAYVDIAAVPAPLLRPEDAPPGETVQRAGWQEIVERRDVLAAAAAGAVLQWDGGKAWPVGHTAQFDPASSPAAAEWTARLTPAPAGQPPTVLERLLLDHTTSVDRVVELLYDEVSGCPALRRVDHMGQVTVYTRVPQRISTVSPLAEVTLGGHTVWIRTADGRLWLAPELTGHGLSWGYRGSGPHALASLLDRLLDDITSPPVTGNETPPDGLFALIKATPQDETTTYKRAQLIAARAA
jgi:hypothetical protein